VKSFRKVSEQNEVPSFILKRFASNNEPSLEQEDPFEGLRERAVDNKRRIAQDEMSYGRAERVAQRPDWERQAAPEKLQPRQINRVTQDEFDVEDMHSGSVRRISAGQQYDTGFRPGSMGSEFFLTAIEADQMVRSGQSFFDPDLADVTRSIYERDRAQFEQKQMRQKSDLVGSRTERRVKREHKRVLDRWANYDKVSGGFVRVANEDMGAQGFSSRFGMTDPTEAARRDMLRQEEVEERMRRKASIRGIEHETPAQRASSWEEEIALRAPTLQEHHRMGWLDKAFRS
jgi:hypothetical protein